ncbi:MAG TPA: 3-isopropylmalate dehydratase large subunit [Patescibacteria group bacterium]|nr:3-isopropylmalate dehydratase large subunit [Patescibacteria group bacterium]
MSRETGSRSAGGKTMKNHPQTLFEKVWNAHIVAQQESYPAVFYIDAHLIHEVTSPQAFNGLRTRGIPVFRTNRTWATMDHNVPTKDQDKPIQEPMSRKQVAMLAQNCEEFGVTLYGLGHKWQGIVHVIGPELGITKPGMTIVCGDSHTSTHGAFGAIAFGIGTSEVEQVLATQTILQYKPKTMNIKIDGTLGKGVTSKDIILYIISKISAAGGTGYFVEYSGSAIRSLSMEARMTICNMSIEMGARGGMIAPDETTYTYMKGRQFAPKGDDWDKAVEYWKTLPSDEGAVYDRELIIDAADIEPMITYGTNPGMGMKITDTIPTVENFAEENQKNNFLSAMEYMGLTEKQGKKLLGHKVDYVFLGSCTNSRIEDFRLEASIIKGKKKPDWLNVFVVPGSAQVAKQLQDEGLDKIFIEAGFDMRGAGCSACLGMNEDKIPAEKYCVSTSNRNFQGRQGPGARTFLASPITAAAAAITGYVSDVREFI